MANGPPVVESSFLLYQLFGYITAPPASSRHYRRLFVVTVISSGLLHVGQLLEDFASYLGMPVYSYPRRWSLRAKDPTFTEPTIPLVAITAALVIGHGTSQSARY
jgi:hypothetical protein